jgi:hemerythrin superfamily protein
MVAISAFILLPAAVFFNYYLLKSKRMACNNSVPIQLTSTAIPSSDNGYYPYEQISFLFPHEPLRRELNRGKKALDQLSISDNTWKLRYFRKWLNEFLVPLIRDHHEAEDKYLFPAYGKLGVILPNNIEKAHDKLEIHLMELERLANSLNEWYFNEKNLEKADETLKSLKSLYNEFYSSLTQHLHEEEIFWPPIVKEKGEENFSSINTAMHKATKQQKTAKLFICSVLDSMGYEFDMENPTHSMKYEDSRWCNEDLLNEKIVNKIPYFVRSWFFPKMNRQYQYYKKMINIIAYENNDCGLPLEYNDSWSCTVN